MAHLFVRPRRNSFISANFFRVQHTPFLHVRKVFLFYEDFNLGQESPGLWNENLKMVCIYPVCNAHLDKIVYAQAWSELAPRILIKDI